MKPGNAVSGMTIDKAHRTNGADNEPPIVSVTWGSTATIDVADLEHLLALVVADDLRLWLPGDPREQRPPHPVAERPCIVGNIAGTAAFWRPEPTRLGAPITDAEEEALAQRLADLALSLADGGTPK